MTTVAWLLEGLVPAGAVVAIADLDDGTPETVLARGFDVVIFLHGRDEMDDVPVLVDVRWRAGLVPGREPPAPFWVRLTPTGFVRVDEGTAA